jgi:hypothetical protein
MLLVWACTRAIYAHCGTFPSSIVGGLNSLIEHFLFYLLMVWTSIFFPLVNWWKILTSKSFCEYLTPKFASGSQGWLFWRFLEGVTKSEVYKQIFLLFIFTFFSCTLGNLSQCFAQPIYHLSTTQRIGLEVVWQRDPEYFLDTLASKREGYNAQKSELKKKKKKQAWLNLMEQKESSGRKQIRSENQLSQD